MIKRTIYSFTFLLFVLFLQAQETDYLIICPDDFYDAASLVKEHHESLGYDVSIYRISEILEGKILTADNIDSWLENYIFENPNLNFVLLLGDIERIPTFHSYYANLQFDSDLWYSVPNDSLNDNYLPQVALGRIPVSNTDQITNYYNKSISFENLSESYNTILFFGNEAEMSYAKNRDMEIAYSIGFDTLSLIDPPEYELFSALNNESVKTVIYYGHGSYLSNMPLSIYNLINWNNTNHPVLYFSGGCSFNDNIVTSTPLGDSMAIAVNGSIASIGASINGGYGYDYKFIEGILKKFKCSSTMGELYNDAMRYHYDKTADNTVGSWSYYFTRRMNFIGDPGLIINSYVSHQDTLKLVYSICEGDSIEIGEQYFSETGNYIVTLSNRYGCDSLVNLDLTVNPTYYSYDALTICESELPYDYNGQIIPAETTSEEIDFTFSSVSGCDSIVTLDLTVNPVYLTSDVLTICENELPHDYNGQTIPVGTTSGELNFTFSSISGCDSVVTLSLIVFTVNTEVVLSGTTLTSDAVDASYQWLDCNDNYSPIIEAVSNSFSPVIDGSYAVQVSQNGCIDTSSCYIVSRITYIENNFGNSLNIYPNPTNGNIKIELSIPYSVTIKLESITGQIISFNNYNQVENIDYFIEEKPGLYILNIYSNESKHAIIKIIKN
ncbi:MAG: T9SS type A sorting domain-containing protein [Ignavibacteriales bacterium]|nr:T9SS type A sorting domain-containing protein [Ignavibacteriales bacterium]